MSIKLISLNVRGLGDALKRRAIFNYYRDRANVICLQETHSQQDNEKIWQAEWGGDILFSHGATNARGVAILLPKGWNKLVKNVKIDHTGRAVMCTIAIDDNEITICTIYAPNKEDTNFFLEIMRWLEEGTEHIILIGDYNIVMDVNKDRVGSTHNKSKVREIIEHITKRLTLNDIWRTKNPEGRVFSWYRSKPKLSASRIDYALISDGMIDQCDNVSYMTGINSDHLAFYLYISMNKNRRGRGYWKLNVTLLRNKEYVEIINTLIDKVTKETENQPTFDRWEFLKYKIREETIEYSKYKTSEQDLIIAQLSEKVTEMENKLEKVNIDLLNRTKSDLEDIIAVKTKGCMFRAKARYYEYGEKSSKYFFNMEKMRYNAKTCNALYDEKGNIIKDEKRILKLQENYYRKLYTSDKSITFDWSTIKNTSNIYVPDEIKEFQEAEFTEQDMSNAIKSLPNNKTCGND